MTSLLLPRPNTDNVDHITRTIEALQQDNTGEDNTDSLSVAYYARAKEYRDLGLLDAAVEDVTHSLELRQNVHTWFVLTYTAGRCIQPPWIVVL